MGKYKILFKKSAVKDLKQLAKADCVRINKKIKQLADNPRPVGAKKLTGENYFRIRIGNYRVIYSIEDHELIVILIKIAHRKKVYKNP